MNATPPLLPEAGADAALNREKWLAASMETADTAGSVAAVLVKSKTDNAGLVAMVEKCVRHAGQGDGS